MTASRIRLDPTVPLCWEDLDTLRLGFERVRARIPAADHGVQRLVAALRDGFAPEDLAGIAQRCGLGPAKAGEVLAALAPAVRAPDAREPGPLRAVLEQGGTPVPGLREALTRIEFLDLSVAGTKQFPGPVPPPAPPDIALHVERFVEPSERAQRWLMAGVPHLLMRFSDSLLQIGPLVGAEGAPCHACTVLTRIARDPTLPVVAAQLIGRRAATELPALARLAAVAAEQILLGWRADDAAVHRTAHVFPASRSGIIGRGRVVAIDPHPDCACVSLPLPEGSGAIPRSRVSRSSPPQR